MLRDLFTNQRVGPCEFRKGCMKITLNQEYRSISTILDILRQIPQRDRAIHRLIVQHRPGRLVPYPSDEWAELVNQEVATIQELRLLLELLSENLRVLHITRSSVDPCSRASIAAGS